MSFCFPIDVLHPCHPVTIFNMFFHCMYAALARPAAVIPSVLGPLHRPLAYSAFDRSLKAMGITLDSLPSASCPLLDHVFLLPLASQRVPSSFFWFCLSHIQPSPSIGRYTRASALPRNHDQRRRIPF